MEREIPGIITNELREYMYVSDDGDDFFMGTRRKKGLFNKVTSLIDPPIPKSGGVITENCRLWLPNGELLHALSYKGDIDGWRKQIQLGAKELGLLVGKISENNIEISDGRTYALSDCKIAFY